MPRRSVLIVFDSIIQARALSQARDGKNKCDCVSKTTLRAQKQEMENRCDIASKTGLHTQTKTVKTCHFSLSVRPVCLFETQDERASSSGCDTSRTRHPGVFQSIEMGAHVGGWRRASASQSRSYHCCSLPAWVMHPVYALKCPILSCPLYRVSHLFFPSRAGDLRCVV